MADRAKGIKAKRLIHQKRSVTARKRGVRDDLLMIAPAVPEQVVRIGGQLINVSGWTDEVIKRLKKDYLLPPATSRLYLARVTLTATCPSRHITQHPVGVMADKASVVQAMCDGLPKARVGVNCPECGRQATVTGKHIYWIGPMAEWDGAI